MVLWDYRGHGRSQRTLDPHVTDMSIARHAEDLAAVLQSIDPEEDERAVVIGHSMGCQVALEVYNRYPERIDGLVLALGTAGQALHTFFDNSASPLFFKAIHRLVFRLGPTFNEMVRPALRSPLAWLVASKLSLVDPLYASREDMTPYMEHLATLDLRLFIESVIQTDKHNAWPTLSTLDCPLLVIAAENDKFTPMWCSRKIVEDSPQAELLVLADASHAALIEQPETINHRVERFLRERVGEPSRG